MRKGQKKSYSTPRMTASRYAKDFKVYAHCVTGHHDKCYCLACTCLCHSYPSSRLPPGAKARGASAVGSGVSRRSVEARAPDAPSTGSGILLEKKDSGWDICTCGAMRGAASHWIEIESLNAHEFKLWHRVNEKPKRNKK